MQIITIPGKPISKVSAKPGHKRLYNSQIADMNAVKWIVKNQVKHGLITGPVYLEVTYYMPIPPSRVKKYGTKEGDWHYVKPDRDNLEKFIYDCMSGIVFVDDCQIADGPVRKIYSDNPRTEIYYYEL